MLRVCAVVSLAAACATPAAAQAPVRTPHRFEVTAGALWMGGASLGSEDAELRANRVPAAPFTLFETSTRAESVAGLDARVGFWLTRSIAVEGGFAFSQPTVRTRISGDVEGAPALTADERVDQYFIDATLVWLLDWWRLTDRTVPFLSGGAGYLRQLHEGQTLVETGQVYNVGGGLRHWLRLRDTGFIRGLGLRIDGRAYVLVKGVQLEARPRTHGALSGSFFVTF